MSPGLFLILSSLAASYLLQTSLFSSPPWVPTPPAWPISSCSRRLCFLLSPFLIIQGQWFWLKFPLSEPWYSVERLTDAHCLSVWTSKHPPPQFTFTIFFSFLTGNFATFHGPPCYWLHMCIATKNPIMQSSLQTSFLPITCPKD